VEREGRKRGEGGGEEGEKVTSQELNFHSKEEEEEEKGEAIKMMRSPTISLF
jgi:hypothetical protein